MFAATGLIGGDGDAADTDDSHRRTFNRGNRGVGAGEDDWLARGASRYSVNGERRVFESMASEGRKSLDDLWNKRAKATNTAAEPSSLAMPETR